MHLKDRVRTGMEPQTSGGLLELHDFGVVTRMSQQLVITSVTVSRQATDLLDSLVVTALFSSGQ